MIPLQKPATGHPLYLLVQRSVALLIANKPKDGTPYFGCFSGGKDSIVIKELARLAEVQVGWHYHMTTIDPPEVIKFIRAHHPDVAWDRPRHGSLFRRVERKGLPTRFRRWCCDDYKEVRGPKGCIKIIGVRVAESTRRARRYTSCVMDGPAHRKHVYPIRLWTDEHVWQFIRERKLPYCSLYDEGFNRIGCIGCPLPGGNVQLEEFKRWPGYERQWRLAARRFYDKRASYTQPDGQPWGVTRLFTDGDDLFEWWLSGISIEAWRARKKQMELI